VKSCSFGVLIDRIREARHGTCTSKEGRGRYHRAVKFEAAEKHAKQAPTCARSAFVKGINGDLFLHKPKPFVAVLFFAPLILILLPETVMWMPRQFGYVGLASTACRAIRRQMMLSTTVTVIPLPWVACAEQGRFDLPRVLADGSNDLSSPIDRRLLKFWTTSAMSITASRRSTRQIETRGQGGRLMTVPGIGPMAITALPAAVGDGCQFRRAGNRYLRKLEDLEYVVRVGRKEIVN
jgi:hypothetical protein